MLNRPVNKYRRRNIVKCEINIVPFLDILLILLLVFMISFPIMTENFVVNLPHSSHSEKIINKNTTQVIIEVLGNDYYNIFIDHKKIKGILSAQIVHEISSKTNTKLSDLTFLIAGDKNISYNDIIKTLNFLHKIGITTVNILTQPIR